MSWTKAERLRHSFEQQVAFARTYAPLYARIFATLADWLAAPADDPVAIWLLDTGRSRRSFDMTNLLAAGLHREVLGGSDAVAGLAPYYPTVGGTARPGPEFADKLRSAIWAARDRLTPFIQSANVQTNETSRGLVWLLPRLSLPWPAMHLVELGASAGLNLAASARSFALEAETGQMQLRLGPHGPVDISVQVKGQLAPLATIGTASPPRIVSRIGGDINPFYLRDEADALTLMAFIWADQPERLERLRRALTTFALVNEGSTPVRLYPLTLPAALPAFLERHVPADDVPLFLYNTYVTKYLPDDGAALPDLVSAYARGQNRPVLWCQLEPARGAPEVGWCAWTVQLWQDGRHYSWQLAWAHPHLTQIAFLADLAAWAAFWLP